MRARSIRLSSRLRRRHLVAVCGGLLTIMALPVFGTSAGAVPAPAHLMASMASVGFENTTLGDISSPVDVTLTNTGAVADPLTGAGVVIGGTNPNDFIGFIVDSDGNSCPSIPANGGTCELLVGFLPGALGLRSATITPTDSGVSPPVIPLQGTGTEGYYETTAGGAVSPFGDAQFLGDTSQSRLKMPIVDVAQTGDGAGYWLTASDGGVFTFGDAPYLGGTGGLLLNKPIVGMALTQDGGGYWLVASDGGIFAFGDAPFFGSTGAIHLNKPIVGMASNPAPNSNGGYWLVASDGGIFTFGQTQFFGSTGSLNLNKPIVGMAATPDGGGYWLVASDGGIFAFGGTHFFGSTGGTHLNQPIVGMAPTPDGLGYWLVAADGGIFAFGDAQFLGSIGGTGVTNAVGMAESGYYTEQAAFDQPAIRSRELANFKARALHMLAKRGS